MIERYNAFCREALIEKEESPYKQPRRGGKIYGMFVIAKQAGEWTDPFLGLEFIGEVQFKKNEAGRRAVVGVIPVRFAGRYAIRGRPVPGRVVNMI